MYCDSCDQSTSAAAALQAGHCSLGHVGSGGCTCQRAGHCSCGAVPVGPPPNCPLSGGRKKPGRHSRGIFIIGSDKTARKRPKLKKSKAATNEAGRGQIEGQRDTTVGRLSSHPRLLTRPVCASSYTAVSCCSCCSSPDPARPCTRQLSRL